MFNNSKILITGATGSWGTTLIKLLLDKYDVEEIRCFSRGELAQVYMNRSFKSDKLKFIIGDVRDKYALNQAMKNIDYVFHLAALKHVPVCEEQPREAIKTNINGTMNIIDCAIENKVKKVIDVSTDKAVEPLNLYGMTKGVGEKLIINANTLSDTIFTCVRGGNVMGSNGSVIPLFIKQIQDKGPLTITSKQMTRYFITLEEAIVLLFKASKLSIGGEIFVMNMPSCCLNSLAIVLMQKYGNVMMKEIGLRPGEKLDEVLISKDEAPTTKIYDNNYYIILPIKPTKELINHYSDYDKFDQIEFTSNTYVMDNVGIANMLEKGGF